MNRGSLAPSMTAGLMVPASMRPRFMNRGSVVHRIQDHVGPGRFNEAPIHESGKYVNPLDRASKLDVLQ